MMMRVMIITIYKQPVKCSCGIQLSPRLIYATGLIDTSKGFNNKKVKTYIQNLHFTGLLLKISVSLA